MIEVKIKDSEVKALLTLDRQITFAAARALTKIAKEAQESSIKAIQAGFVTRAKWYLPSNKFGVRVQPARKDDLEAAVHTQADWLALHETGGTKQAGGKSLAIPIVGTGRARPRLTSKVRRQLKPRALGKRAFVIQTASGPVLFYRRGKRQKLTALYNLEPQGRIRRRSTIVEPTMKVVERRFDDVFERSLREAISTAK